MRAFGLVGSVLLVCACDTPETQAGNRLDANASSERPARATAEPVRRELRTAQSKSEAQGNPCLTQDEEPVTHKLKAVGTEPFWAAEVEGRCVTYKTPENQKGARVWTHVDTGPDGPAWNGALRGRQFQLYVKPRAPPGCSDGMSDKVYPLEAVMRVDGETRYGCAERL